MKVEQRLPLNMDAAQIAGLLKLADQLEGTAFGPERENRYTQIVVNLTDAEPIPDAPIKSLCDHTGDGFDVPNLKS